MNAQLQVNDGRMYDARLSYRPSDFGGVLVLTAHLGPPYPPEGEVVISIYLDGYRVNSTTAEMPGETGYGVVLEQVIELEFNRVP